MFYFAYGSNLDADRMRERGINFSSRQYAKLTGYKLTFNKKASAGNFGYANIMESKDDIVEGALYEFPDNEIINLDKREGYPDHYDKISLTVMDQNNNPVNAVAYIAKHDKVVEGLLPIKEYLNHLLAGNDILSEGYFNKLRQVATAD